MTAVQLSSRELANVGIDFIDSLQSRHTGRRVMEYCSDNVQLSVKSQQPQSDPKAIHGCANSLNPRQLIQKV
jgi:hypothetical protein